MIGFPEDVTGAAKTVKPPKYAESRSKCAGSRNEGVSLHRQAEEHVLGV